MQPIESWIEPRNHVVCSPRRRRIVHSSMPSAASIDRHRHEHEAMSTTCCSACLQVPRLETDTRHAQWHQWERRRVLPGMRAWLDSLKNVRFNSDRVTALQRVERSRPLLLRAAVRYLYRCPWRKRRPSRARPRQGAMLRARLARIFGKANPPTWRMLYWRCNASRESCSWHV